ncbi:hypothetical protein ACB094_03G062000 [Castanea mollissima]
MWLSSGLEALMGPLCMLSYSRSDELQEGFLIVKSILCKRPNFQQDNLTIDEESDKLPWVKQLSLPNNGECTKGLAVKQTSCLTYWESDKRILQYLVNGNNKITTTCFRSN